ncbi:hypothetical protein CDAR_227651 [Caerostris darwini]|uniref:RING-type E3 ubiquitin transferase n=1 Tax=Caerostris darwini TaxID=1538125 RepID=A0AAV4RRH0_9ARAC|nr:hypothetical protein CDAR_227651 [Caerostris darwini]
MSQNRNYQEGRMQEAGPSSLDEECVICFEPIRNVAGTSSCSHRFCLPCLSEWAKKKKECPICKLKFDNIVFPVQQQNNTFENHSIPSSAGLMSPSATAQGNSLGYVPNNPRPLFRNIEYIPNQSMHHVSKNMPRLCRRPVPPPYNLRPRSQPQNSCCSYHRGQMVSYTGNDSLFPHGSSVFYSSPPTASSSAPVFPSLPAAAPSSASVFSSLPAAAPSSAPVYSSSPAADSFSASLFSSLPAADSFPASIFSSLPAAAASFASNSNSINVGPSSSGLINITYNNVPQFQDDDCQIIKIVQIVDLSSDEEESEDELLATFNVEDYF